jgi:leucyl-tRNA synthetase
MIARDLSEEEVKKIALEDEALTVWIAGKDIKKVIYVPGRLVNIVV